MSVVSVSAALIAEALKLVEHRANRGEEITVRQLAADAHISDVTARTLLRGWLKAGIIRKAAKHTDRRPLYEVVPQDERPTSPRRTAEQNMWDAMRGLTTFSPVDVMAHANTDSVTVTERQASDYCQSLLAGGYLRVERKGTKSRPPSYRLIRKTGPLAPLERRVRALVDANTGERHVIGVHK